MLPDPLRLTIALVPLASYGLLIGLLNARRRPFLTTGGADLAALAAALSGLILVGPIELFRPEAASAEFGSYVWLFLLVFYWLCVWLAVLLAKPRLVVYNVTIDELRPVLAETARTIAVTMPFLSQAEKVCVLTIEGGTVIGPTGEQVAQHLRRNGINAVAETRSAGGRSIGEAMIDGCKEIGANLLIKGAFTNSRLRQMIFGGATRDIIEKSDVATILAH